MKKVIKKLAPIIKVPLVIDSTELDVLEIALQTAPGKCLINSTNLEAGPDKAKKVFQLAKKYNAAVIVLTIDENGMAKTAERKLAIAERLVKMAVNEFGLKPSDMVIDSLTFTLATGEEEYRRSALETIEGIQNIKATIPGVLTSLGVSNVSFGLSPAARATLNSVMLYHAVQGGLDMAIVNPAQITPYSEIADEEKKLAEDLILDRQPDALQKLINYYEEHGNSAVDKVTKQEEILNSLPTDKRVYWRIVHREKQGVEEDIDLLMTVSNFPRQHDRAVEILNTVLLPAMKEVGDKFGAGELILPFVLQSAEVMKKSVAHLENYLEKKEGVSKGLIVLATVYGDVHDIGKNLVKTILSNNGYDVVDLGKQVPAETIISKAEELSADAIGLSALLVSTSKQMPLIINELHRRKHNIPVLIGGAAINRKFGRRILKTDQDEFYPAGVFYCKDAFEGLSVMDQISDPLKRKELIEKNKSESENELERAQTQKNQTGKEQKQKISVEAIGILPEPPSWGVKIVKEMPLEAVFQYLSKNELFRLSWGAKNTHGEAWTQLEKEYNDRLLSMKLEAQKSHWLHPQGVYGYFPVQSQNNQLLIFDPNTISSEKAVVIERFEFPRQNGGENLCLADYFATVESGRFDTVVFQVVTVGEQATERFDSFQDNGDYTEAYFNHGLAVQTAEAAAEYLHRHIRRELGLKDGQGKRYSWGYPAIPELEDHKKVFSLLPVEKELGMQLTSAYQLLPEQSTAAIIVHHPEAKYFNIGTTRIDQLMKDSN
jgi:5-methyltetrahydrofolate--homocysteine methyltransferase